MTATEQQRNSATATRTTCLTHYCDRCMRDPIQRFRRFDGPAAWLSNHVSPTNSKSLRDPFPPSYAPYIHHLSPLSHYHYSRIGNFAFSPKCPRPILVLPEKPWIPHLLMLLCLIIFDYFCSVPRTADVPANFKSSVDGLRGEFAASSSSSSSSEEPSLETSCLAIVECFPVSVNALIMPIHNVRRACPVPANGCHSQGQHPMQGRPRPSLKVCQMVLCTSCTSETASRLDRAWRLFFFSHVFLRASNGPTLTWILRSRCGFAFRSCRSRIETDPSLHVSILLQIAAVAVVVTASQPASQPVVRW